MTSSIARPREPCDAKARDTLQATALVHEAYLRLVDQRRVEWRNRAHFFGVAAQMMRRVLVDRVARAPRLATKRGGEFQQVTLGDAEASDAEDSSLDVLALHEALERLAAWTPIRRGWLSSATSAD